MSDPRSSVDIAAPAQQVWDILTDWQSFPSWNPFIRSAQGRLVVGNRVTIRLQLGRRLITFRPRLIVVDPPGELQWLVRQRVPGLFDVRRRFVVQPTGHSSSRLIQSETGSGLFAPLVMWLMRRDVLEGYRSLERAMKARAEHQGVGPAPGTQPSKGNSAMATSSSTGTHLVGPPVWKKRITSHETFSHDSIDSLAYDWERVANPGIAPKFPLKVYLPGTTDDIVAVVREAGALGERLAIRSKGHSSNDLVLTDGGSMLLTERLNQVLEIDEDAMTVKVQSGAISAVVDDELAQRGLGLPIIGDHNHITVGGFASVGGISPASHRFGLFVDTVQSLEYVTWDGELRTCSRDANAEEFHVVLTGLGRHGVIATLTLRIIGVDKYGTVLKNDQRHYYDVEKFIAGSARAIRNPGDAVMERGVWADLPVGGGRTFGIGQFSAYHPTGQTDYARRRDNLAYNALHSIGYVAGRLPVKVDRALKMVGMGGVMFSPTFATMKNVEFFTDKILDSTAGDPTRMFIALAPLENYEELFRQSWDLMVEFRREHDCFTFISVYVKSITSPYLAQGGENQSFCELMFYCGMSTGGLDASVQDDLVDRFDDICIAQSGFRYMHTKTSKDPVRRAKVDPNAHYTRLNTHHDTVAPEQKGPDSEAFHAT